MSRGQRSFKLKEHEIPINSDFSMLPLRKKEC